MVHLIRASMRFFSDSDRKKIAAELKKIYTAPNEETALATLAEFESSAWGAKYPQGRCRRLPRRSLIVFDVVVASWHSSFCEFWLNRLRALTAGSHFGRSLISGGYSVRDRRSRPNQASDCSELSLGGSRLSSELHC